MAWLYKDKRGKQSELVNRKKYRPKNISQQQQQLKKKKKKNLNPSYHYLKAKLSLVGASKLVGHV